ncbi:MAG: sulfatase-like hydrolase/transferase [Anaerolineae bacterium]|nr:sulfatase-like hydrolase/transferase [Anaerolineae bacterium]
MAALRAIEDNKDGITSSFFLPRLWDRIFSKQRKNNADKFQDLFPLGLPNVKDNDFLLETAVDWLKEQVPAWPQPFLGYFHFLPPHDPYKTRRDFFHTFANDGWEPPWKPEHPFPMGETRINEVRMRAEYDEFILYVDAEFKRLYDSLAQAKILDNTWLVFTSDHGEMFERGITGHTHLTLLEPRTKIPLLIFPPGGTNRIDVYDYTSAVDVLPSLLNLTGHAMPNWREGILLPPFNTKKDKLRRPIYNLESDDNEKFGPFTLGTFMIIRNGVKLIYYFGYPNQPNNKPYYEMYDLKKDPQEMKNLYSEDSPVAGRLRSELLAKIEEVNRPYSI